jgi:hypothetical protein
VTESSSDELALKRQQLEQVKREIQRTGGLGVIAGPVRSTSRALRLRFSCAAALGRSRMHRGGLFPRGFNKSE